KPRSPTRLILWHAFCGSRGRQAQGGGPVNNSSASATETNLHDSRDQSYLQHGSTFVDRLRTSLVCRSVLAHVPKQQNLRALDIGCGYHATFLKALGSRLSQGVGIDSAVGEEVRRQPHLRFALGAIESELPKQPDAAFDVVLLISVLEHLWDAETCL